LYEGRNFFALTLSDGDLLGEFSLKRALTLMMSYGSATLLIDIWKSAEDGGGVHAAVEEFLFDEGQICADKG
jgi:hypothetical protein